MRNDLPDGSLLLLDACCIINFFATGRIEEILRALPYEFATTRYVAAREVLSIAGLTAPGAPLAREVISSEQLEALHDLTILDLSSEEELGEFVRFARDLDDGEASVCALAVAHGGTVATDDRKILRLLRQAQSLVPSVQTPEILYEWARLTRAPKTEIHRMLAAVRHRARFYPRRDAPRFDWWDGFFS